MRLRQVATVARELEPVVGRFRAILGIDVAYRDPRVAASGHSRCRGRRRESSGWARRWAQVLGCVAAPRGDARWEIPLDRGRLVFTPLADGADEGVAAFHFDTSDARGALDEAVRRGCSPTDGRVRVGGVDLCFLP